MLVFPKNAEKNASIIEKGLLACTWSQWFQLVEILALWAAFEKAVSRAAVFSRYPMLLLKKLRDETKREKESGAS